MGMLDLWKRKGVDPELFNDAREGDIIVPVMGPTGAGKSTFINNYLGRDAAKVGHNLLSCTEHVQAFCIPLPSEEYLGDNRRLVLVDTPGFSDTNESDAEMLRRIAVWLASSYGKGKTCGGLIYLHDMTNSRMRGATLQHLNVFKKLCGKKNLGFVVFGTTKSGNLTPEAFARREKQLSDQYWKDFRKQGATVFKLQSTHQSAVDLVKLVLNRVGEEQCVLLIQKELVELKKIVPETEAGKELTWTLQDIMEYQMKALAGEELTNEQIAGHKTKISVVASQLEELKGKLSFSQRLLKFFGLTVVY